MNKNRIILGLFSFLHFTLAFCQEYVIEADEQVPFAINEARIFSKQGFSQAVFLYAEFMNSDDVLVFHSGKIDFTKEITAKYYSQGSILALALYLDSNKTTLLARQELRRPAVIQTENGKTLRNLDIHIPLASSYSSRLKPGRYLPIIFLLSIIIIMMLTHGKQASARQPSAIILSVAALAAAAMILLYSEKPGLIELSASDTRPSRSPTIMAGTEGISYLHVTDRNLESGFSGYSYLIIQSCGSRRFPLASLSAFPAIRFAKIPVIEFSQSREYFLQKNTNVNAWAENE